MSSSESKAFAESVSQILELCMLRLLSYEDADVEQQEGEGEEDDALNQDERMIVVSPVFRPVPRNTSLEGWASGG